MPLSMYFCECSIQWLIGGLGPGGLDSLGTLLQVELLAASLREKLKDLEESIKAVGDTRR